MDPVAFAGVVSAGVVGMGGLILTGYNNHAERQSRREDRDAQRAEREEENRAAREHERRLARDARLFDRRADVYEEVLKFLELVMLRIERTWPIIGPVPEPPPLPGDEAEAELRGRFESYASPEAVDALTRVNDAA